MELHRHLEGAIRPQTVYEEGRRHGIKESKLSFEAFEEKLLIKKPMKNLREVLDRFWLAQSILKDQRTFKRIAYEAVEDAHAEGIKLLELRYSPAFCAQNHKLDFESALNGIREGFQKALNHYPVKIGLIGIISRALPMNEALRTVDFMVDHKDLFVGLDLADEEPSDPIVFRKLTDRARENGMKLTVHSGEEGDPQKVEACLNKLSPDRIGHGIQIHRDRRVLELVKKSKVLLEVCPTSNVLTQAVSSLENHPIRTLYEEGVLVSLNTDDPCLMNIDLPHEYEVCAKTFGFNRKEFLCLNQNALKASFLPEDQKSKIQDEFKDEI